MKLKKILCFPREFILEKDAGIVGEERSIFSEHLPLAVELVDADGI